MDRGGQVSKIDDELSYMVKFISVAKFGLEHLMEKLMHIKVKEKGGTTTKPCTTEDYIQDLFVRIWQKIRQLLEDLSKHDVNDYFKKMTDEQVSRPRLYIFYYDKIVYMSLASRLS